MTIGWSDRLLLELGQTSLGRLQNVVGAAATAATHLRSLGGNRHVLRHIDVGHQLVFLGYDLLYREECPQDKRDDDHVQGDGNDRGGATRFSFIGSMTAMGFDVRTSGGSFRGYSRS